MALITCFDCGASVSDMAPMCPKCGRPSAAAPVSVIPSAANRGSSDFAELKFKTSKRERASSPSKTGYWLLLLVSLSLVAGGIGFVNWPAFRSKIVNIGNPSSAEIAAALWPTAQSNLTINGYLVPDTFVKVVDVEVHSLDPGRQVDGASKSYAISGSAKVVIAEDGLTIASKLPIQKSSLDDLRSSVYALVQAKQALRQVRAGETYTYRFIGLVALIDGKIAFIDGQSDDAILVGQGQAQQTQPPMAPPIVATPAGVEPAETVVDGSSAATGSGEQLNDNPLASSQVVPDVEPSSRNEGTSESSSVDSPGTRVRSDFECSVATEPVEIRICNDGQLLRAERELRIVSSELSRSGGDSVREIGIDGHSEWLSSRNDRCQELRCFLDETDNRTRYLNSLMGR
ncbi:hypothetical protein EON76_06695 [bacterium]|nr:MAG: hypothetical protein EON76_06695 [bacterium]